MSSRLPLPAELEQAVASGGPLFEGEARRRLVQALARLLRDAEREDERLEQLRRIGR